MGSAERGNDFWVEQPEDIYRLGHAGLRRRNHDRYWLRIGFFQVVTSARFSLGECHQLVDLFLVGFAQHRGAEKLDVAGVQASCRQNPRVCKCTNHKGI